MKNININWTEIDKIIKETETDNAVCLKNNINFLVA
jgi:hypothetical protein